VSLAAGQIHLIRYALAAGPLPPITQALAVGELARRSVLSRFGGPERLPAPPSLSGHVGDQPLRDQHRHAFFLPQDADGDGLLDQLAIWCPDGLEAAALPALLSLSGLYPGDGRAGWPLRLLEMSDAAGDLWTPAAEWESVTPFVLSRFPKQYKDGTPKLNERGEQRDGPEDQARREWALRQQVEPALPDLVAVEQVPQCVVRGRPLPWRSFEVGRGPGQGSSSGFVYGLRLRFAGPVGGPVALGFGCHFGLGLFRSAGTGPGA